MFARIIRKYSDCLFSFCGFVVLGLLRHKFNACLIRRDVNSSLFPLRQDQVKKLASVGLKTAFVGGKQELGTLRDIEGGKHSFVNLTHA